MKSFIIACAIIFICSGQSTQTVNGVTVDNALNRRMLDIHNELRGVAARAGLNDGAGSTTQPKATYMNELHFDPALAALAQNYLDAQKAKVDAGNSSFCSITKFGHNDNRKTEFQATYASSASFEWDSQTLSIGENILEATRDTCYTTDAQAAIQAESGWWDEYEVYNYNSLSCSPNSEHTSCGHYTQMVWADTRYVGCGSITCTNSNGYTQLISLCNYYPAGNNGQPPYPEATGGSSLPCSDCSASAPDRAACSTTAASNVPALCSGCQAPKMTRCADSYGNCNLLEEYCPSECDNAGIDADFSGIQFNGPLCDGCAHACNTCSTADKTASSCNGSDGLSYQVSDDGYNSQSCTGGFIAADEDDDPEVIAERANWAIAGMCMVFGACCIVLGIGYYLHQRKVDQLKLKLKSIKLINNGKSKDQNVKRASMSETIDGNAINVTNYNGGNGDNQAIEVGIEIDQSVDRTHQ